MINKPLSCTTLASRKRPVTIDRIASAFVLADEPDELDKLDGLHGQLLSSLERSSCFSRLPSR
jgi:hypothetical protein